MLTVEQVQQVVDVILAGRKATPGPWIKFSDEGKVCALLPAGRPGEICKVKGLKMRDANAIVMWSFALPATEAILREAAEGWRCERPIKRDYSVDISDMGSDIRYDPCGTCAPCRTLAQVERLDHELGKTGNVFRD